jgi:hypothetical protein
MISSVGLVSTLVGSVAGYADGIGTNAMFNQPRGIAIGPSGMLYVADYSNHAVRRIDPLSRYVITVAGSPAPSYADGLGSKVGFNGPISVGISPNGQIYVGDGINRRVRKLTLTVGTSYCFAGWFGPIENATSCQACPPGHFCPQGATAPTMCPLNFFCLGKLALPELCPFGSVCDVDGLVQPKLCSAGHYCGDLGLSASLPCPVGTFNNLRGANSSMMCLQCPPGQYCPALGLMKPINCPDGLVSVGHGNSVCSVCPPNFIALLNTTSSIGSSQCIVCPEGQTCWVGSSRSLSSDLFQTPQLLQYSSFDPFKNSVPNFDDLLFRITSVMASLAVLVSAAAASIGCWIELSPLDGNTQWIGNFDLLFASVHYFKIEFSPKNALIYQSRLGGIMSVACLFSVVCGGTILAAQNYYVFDASYQLDTQPLVVEPFGTYRVILTAFGGSSTDCNASKLTNTAGDRKHNWYVSGPAVFSTSSVFDPEKGS